MYCWNCGKEMDDALLFCPHCAMKQAGIPEPKPKRMLPVLPLLCGGACLVVLLVLILASLVLVIALKRNLIQWLGWVLAVFAGILCCIPWSGA